MPHGWRILIHFDGCKNMGKIVRSKGMNKYIETHECSVISLVVNFTDDVFFAYRITIWCAMRLWSQVLGRIFGIFPLNKNFAFWIKGIGVIVLLLILARFLAIEGHRRSRCMKLISLHIHSSLVVSLLQSKQDRRSQHCGCKKGKVFAKAIKQPPRFFVFRYWLPYNSQL